MNLTMLLVSHGDRALAFEQKFRRERLDFDAQVLARSRRSQVADRAAATSSIPRCGLIIAGAFLSHAVEVVIARDAELHGRSDECIAQLMLVRNVRHVDWTAGAAPFIRPMLMVFRFSEVRQQIVERPSRHTPGVVVLALP